MASPKQFYILSEMGYTRNEIANMDEQAAWDAIAGNENFNVKEKEVYRLKNKSGEKYAYKGSDGKIKLTDDKDEALSGGHVKEKEIKNFVETQYKKDPFSYEKTTGKKEVKSEIGKQKEVAKRTEQMIAEREREERESKEVFDAARESVLQGYSFNNENLYFGAEGKTTANYNDIAKSLTRFLQKEFDAEIYHSSGKGKYDSSVYFEINGERYRLSDHNLPQTAARGDIDYKEGWAGELVLESNKQITRLFRNKTKEELKQYLKENWIREN